MHQSGLEKLGAKTRIEHGCVVTETEKLTGAKIMLDFPSVGATENILTAAVLAEGTTVLDNAAREPEIVDLCHMLRDMGAQLEGEEVTRSLSPVSGNSTRSSMRWSATGSSQGPGLTLLR